MPAGSGVAGTVSIILLAAAPVLVHRATFGSASPWLVCAVALLQIAAIAWLLTGRWATRYRAIVGLSLLAAASTAMLLPGLPARFVGLAVGGFCHAVAYASLLLWFGLSLRPDHEPVVTGFARRLRRTMPDKVVRYTRRVTIAWCSFFAAQLGVSAALLMLAPQAVWSTFVNLLNLPLLIAMVLAEFGCRLLVFRHEPHTSLIDTLAAMRRTRFVPTSRS